MATNQLTNKASSSVTDNTVQDFVGIQSSSLVASGSFVIPSSTNGAFRWYDQNVLPSSSVIVCYASSPTTAGVSVPLVSVSGSSSSLNWFNVYFGNATTSATIRVNYYIA
jgi:hypothetical protein